MIKADKIESMLRHLAPGESRSGLDPCYQGYFTCFNTQRYYEAHDVLEHLWLQTSDASHGFYKGLIQLAGAFVHLQKQFQRPNHPKDATRTRPAARLFQLAARNLAPYRPFYLHLDVERVWALSNLMANKIADSNFSNPWTPENAPVLSLN